MSRNYIHYYAEALPHGRAILRRDVVIEDRIVPELSHTVGSPAPMETVKRHEEYIYLTEHNTTREQ